MKTKYTVLLAYPGLGIYEPIETFMAHTLAESPADAVEHARKRCVKETRCGEWGDPPGSDLEAIAVLKGWLEDVRT